MLRSRTCQLIHRLHPRVASASVIADCIAERTSKGPCGRNKTMKAFHWQRTGMYLSSTRFFSSSTNEYDHDDTIDETTISSSSSSIDETLNRLFEENKLIVSGSTSDSTAMSNVVASTLTEYEASTWYNLADHAIVAVGQIHEMTGLDYGWSIVCLTTGLRLALFPMMGLAQQTTTRMAHVQPELQQLQAKIQRLGTPTRAEQMQFANQYKALFRKYQVRPMWAFIAPILQLPIFGGLFFGLRKMPELFPQELSSAGMFWFPDLTLPDPMYILPILSSVAVLGMFELSKKQMMAQSSGPQGVFIINFFRAMAVLMVPVTMDFSTTVLLMWTTNSTLMFIQTALFQTTLVRKAFGIWELPKPPPGQPEAKGLVETVTDMVNRAKGEATTEPLKIERHNQEVEARKMSFRLARERRRRRQKTGITGTRNV